MRIETYETEVKTFPIYRITFQESRLRKILKQFAEDHHGLMPGSCGDPRIIRKFLLTNKSELSEAIAKKAETDKEQAREELEEIRTEIRGKGSKACKMLIKAEKLEESTRRYDKKDESKTQRAEEIKEELREWDRSVEEILKTWCEALGFLQSREIDVSEFDETTLGASRQKSSTEIKEES